ncbi:hypothetical protein [Saccharopolyspora shandongensis]|uniref:hypothetical protein n=1 Tax=Saccharopolyspora shandongensis TaxID=418495 RepID=UPI000B8A52AF|nr:hypothetical protein [Saccharopolyspora shandongensis]
MVVGVIVVVGAVFGRGDVAIDLVFGFGDLGLDAGEFGLFGLLGLLSGVVLPPGFGCRFGD